MQELKRLSAFIDYRRKGNEALSDQFVAPRAFFLQAAASEAHPDSVRAGQLNYTSGNGYRRMFSRSIVCFGANAAHFQGDERDVMFLSMVDGPPDDGQLTLRDAGPKNVYKKRYNVAVSRARDQLWVVYSMDPNTHLKSGDLRRRLIEHAWDPQALLREIDARGIKTESQFEKLVLKRLVDAGFRVHPQWTVGTRRIDLVVEGRTRRLAVECDGERWHTPEQLNDDLERQAMLERLGWTFIRIRGSVFFRDEGSAMAPVLAKLNDLGIEPLGPGQIQDESHDKAPLVERIRRHAQALTAKWLAIER